MISKAFLLVVTKKNVSKCNNTAIIAIQNYNLFFLQDSSSLLSNVLGQSPVGAGTSGTSKAKGTPPAAPKRVLTKVPSNYKLPTFTHQLETIEKAGELYMKQGKFIAFWAQDLLRLTNDRPVSNDYSNYADAIIREHPELASGDKNTVST